MKKPLSVTLLVALLLSLLTLTVSAEGPTATVYVTVANGTLCLANEAITVTDCDNDGVLTIHDALYAAHEAKFQGGASAGYATATGDYGLYMTSLWGVSNGVSYGYYRNSAMAMSMADPVAHGDTVTAFVYQDVSYFSDLYCYFADHTLTAKAGETVTVTLSVAGFDENWNPVVLPLTGATLTMNGTATESVTDENGQATITVSKGGTYLLSATKEGTVLVPPACTLTVEGPTGNMTKVYVIGGVVLVALIVAFALRKKSK